MKKIYLISLILIIFACDIPESKNYYMANPPVDIEITRLTSGTFAGDYLLLFRSENDTNGRFGGFLVFINTSQELVLDMTSPEDAGYALGFAASPEENPSVYNPGIDTQVAILFTNNTTSPDTTVSDNSSTDHTIAKRLNKNLIIPGNWLTLRSYIWNTEILEVSPAVNAVEIP